VEIKREEGARGVRYKVRVSWQEGKRQRQTCRRFRTMGEARRWGTEQENRRHHGGVLRQATRVTLNEWLDRWLRSLPDLAARTRVDYERVTARYWRGPLGGYRLDQLTTQQVRDVLADLAARGLSARTRQQARTVLRIALGAAVDDGVVAVNAAVGKRMVPAEARREHQVLSAAEVNALLDGTRDDALGALWAVLATTGLRLGEALGLLWSDLDLDRAELRVQRSLVRPTHGTDWLLEAPKTEKSRRAVPLLARTVDALKWHRTRQEAQRITAGAAYAEHGFVFATPSGEPLQGTVVYKYHWRPTLTRLGLPTVRLHDLRHSAATLWLEAGLPLKLVQELLGHASMTITADVYSHILPAYRRQAADVLAAHLDQARSTE
jgi:integrase